MREKHSACPLLGCSHPRAGCGLHPQHGARRGLLTRDSHRDASLPFSFSLKSIAFTSPVGLGCGSVLNVNGEVEMDASIMNGKDLSSGAVSAVRCVANPIRLARLVMEKVCDQRPVPTAPSLLPVATTGV